ncbi:hypothetical protein BT67DRAFT_61790 [Trichocladium antarcticum]|uniref:Uncharacterized protein n=1 Tax=Trichocladium antarcticum TaxID=1450529 RepID=A0AAN6UHT5_9PEZI|nr:hypothetical protein BT67DRAFT_61790 [Trichocladium antarcticum]
MTRERLQPRAFDISRWLRGDPVWVTWDGGGSFRNVGRRRKTKPGETKREGGRWHASRISQRLEGKGRWGHTEAAEVDSQGGSVVPWHSLDVWRAASSRRARPSVEGVMSVPGVPLPQAARDQRRGDHQPVVLHLACCPAVCVSGLDSGECAARSDATRCSCQLPTTKFSHSLLPFPGSVSAFSFPVAEL